MSSKRVTHEGEATETNEIEKMDAVLCTLIGNKSLLRLLVKTRVSVLNI
ncbi:hypothetical protein Golax_023175, partial [Gossypium laxum]|nr:hypothetical protein [Gossypium laxum]